MSVRSYAAKPLRPKRGGIQHGGYHHARYVATEVNQKMIPGFDDPLCGPVRRDRFTPEERGTNQ